MEKGNFAFWIGIAGGGIFVLLSLSGAPVPGGFLGGALGMILFGGPAYLLLKGNDDSDGSGE